MTEEEYLHLREQCLLMAGAAPDEHVRASLLRAARNYEIEARLIKHAAPRIAESRAAIAKADAVLRGTLQGR